jgi:hypothetical protein
MDLQIDTAIDRQEDMEETDHLDVGTRQEDMTTEAGPWRRSEAASSLATGSRFEEEAHRHL